MQRSKYVVAREKSSSKAFGGEGGGAMEIVIQYTHKP